ncbi:MAG TPA: cysteine desulfurase family protein [Acidimicrobiales bacterium]|nr:cysteine desulfurase family protein [Acidimicrobiales bacterium]
MARHYLDHASTSPARPEVVDAMLPWLSFAADPGRVHTDGRQSRGAIEGAREQVAALLGARPREVVFTGGATEAIVAAVWGATEQRRHVVVPAVEHSAVRDASAAFGDVTEVGVDGVGRMDPAEVLAAIRPGETGLVHVQWANHEVGTLQPVADVVGGCRERGVLVHVDAACAAGHLPVDFRALGADLLSVSAHKLGGPQGVGALVVRRGLRLRPLLVGGEQERSRRAGMENVAGIVGFGAAAATLTSSLDDEAAQARLQTDALMAAATAVDGVVTYGDPVDRVPHVACLGVAGVEAEAVLLGLDQGGIAAHSGSACSSESLEPSPVLAAMGVEAERSLRLSVGWSTTDADVDGFRAAFPGVVSRLRSLRAVSE